jgi:hypothetical protein
LGIDLIKKHGLALDVITNKPYFVNTKNEATVTKDTFLPARSRQMCKIKVPKNFNKKNSEENNVVLQIDVPDCSQIFVDELLIDPNEEGYAQIYLTNVSQLNIKISKDTIVGQVEAVCEKDMTPFRVSSTTPFVSTKMVEKMVVPLLDAKRKQRILDSADLSHLPPDLKDKYIELLYINHACISLDEFDLGRCNRGQHSIPTKPGHPPSYQKQFPLAIEHEKEIRRQVLEWLKIGIIRPVESEYNSSLFLVAKKSPPAKSGEGPRPKAYRIVQDLRALNKNTLPSNVRLPEIHECLDRIADKKPTVFSALDLRSGYFQLPIEKDSQEKTAFTCISLGQQYCFKVTSQGLTSAPASFARTMQRIFSKQIARNDLEVYLDDVLAYSKDHKEMLRTLDEAMKNLISSGMKINIDKCQFGIDKLTYLGFELDKHGYKPDPIKSEGIINVHEPNTLKGVRSFMGMANFYRLLIPRFAETTKPLTRLTCKGVWSGGELPECAKLAFKKCQSLFTKRPFLHYPDFNLKMHLYVDASLGDVDNEKEGGLAGCLVQYPNNDIKAKCRPIGFCSRGLQKHEKNYSAHLIETAGIIFSIEFFEKYLRTKFVCHTDHKPITTVKEGKVHRRTLERFREILAKYDFELEYTPGDEMPSDFMSRHAKVASVSFDSLHCKDLHLMLVNKIEGNDKETKKIQTNENKEESACTQNVVHVESSTVRRLEEVKNLGLASEDQSRSEHTTAQPQKFLSSAQSYWARAQEAVVQAIRAEECVQHVKPSQNSPQCAKKLEIGCCAKKNKSDDSTAATKVGAAATTATTTTVHATSIFLAPRATLRKKIADVTRDLTNLTKLSVCGVKGKIESFNFHDTTLDKNPVLLKTTTKHRPIYPSNKIFSHRQGASYKKIQIYH